MAQALVETALCDRVATRREYVMTRPEFFTVSYAINPWMDPSQPVDVSRALSQWHVLRETYHGLGHSVDSVPPVEGLPDMVYAANGGLIVDGKVYSARFAFKERVPEGPAYAAWFAEAGFPVVTASFVNEGEGDFLTIGQRILAGHGFRTDVRSHAEVAAMTGREVISLELVNPRYYHLDTALAVLTDVDIAYYPAAFAAESREMLRQLYPDAIIATDEDAAVLGLNAVSDGFHVVLTDAATGLHQQLRDRGFEPIGVDLSEIIKGGGSVKCCTLEMRR